MRSSLIVACLAMVGCGGIRIGTDDTVGTGVEAGFVALYRPADFVRFPGDRDSVVARRVVDPQTDLEVPASSMPLLLSLWSPDSSVGAWVRDPTPGVPAIRATSTVSIDLTDSVTHCDFELSVVGTGYGSLGTRPDSNRTRHKVRSPGGMATIAVRWSVMNARRIAYIDSVSLDRDRVIDVSRLSGLPDGARMRLDGSGAVVVEGPQMP